MFLERHFCKNTNMFQDQSGKPGLCNNYSNICLTPISKRKLFQKIFTGLLIKSFSCYKAMCLAYTMNFNATFSFVQFHSDLHN